MAKGKGKLKNADAESGATSNPIAEPTIPEALALNRSDEVTEVLQASYNFVMNCPSSENMRRKDKKMFKTLINQVDTVYGRFTHNDIILENIRIRDRIGLAQVFYYLSRLYLINAIIDINSAVRYIIRAMQLLDGYELLPEVFMTAIRVFYNACYITLKFERFNGAQHIAELAMRTFRIYRIQNSIDLLSVDAWCVSEEEEQFNIQARLMLYYTGIVTKIIDMCHMEEFKESHKFKAITYQHTLLKEYLHVKAIYRSVDKFFEISHELFTCFLKLERRFREARDHVAAACFVFSCYLRQTPKNILSNFKSQKYFVDINLMWSTYGSRLLQLSCEQLEKSKSSPVAHYAKSKLTLLFNEMKDELKPYNSMITDTPVSDYNDISELFVFVVLAAYRSFLLEDLKMKFRIMHFLHLSDACKYFACYQLNPETKTQLFTRQYYYFTHILSFENHPSILQDVDQEPIKYLFLLTHLKKAVILCDSFEHSYERYEPFDCDMIRYDDKNECIKTVRVTTANYTLEHFETYLHDIKDIL